MKKKLLQLLVWSGYALVGLLAIWLIGGNLLADRQEKEIDRDWEQFAAQFPKTETNDSALKLTALTAKLGIGLYDSGGLKSPTDSYPSLHSTQADKQAYQTIERELKIYMNALIASSNDAVPVLPENLRRYLASKSAVLEAIRSHVLTNEVPNWEINIDYLPKGDPSFVWTSWLGFANLHQILALDILEKNRQGKTVEALASLEVSWKINKALWNRPELIGQLVAIIVSQQQLAVIRRLDNLPIEWQDRLLEHDYQKSILTSLQGETFYVVGQMGSFPFYYYIDDPSRLDWLIRLTSPISKPYFRFAAIDYYQFQTRRYSQIPQQNFCLLDSGKSKLEGNIAWWNLAILPYFFSQWPKGGKQMLRLELTQKILQVKAQAAKLGRWPQSVPHLESSICPGQKWLYQVSSDGTMSLTFSQQLTSTNNKPEKLTYQAKFTKAKSHLNTN